MEQQQRTFQVNLELGHRVKLRAVTHDWTVFVRGPQAVYVQHFIEKVVFHLHESYPKPKRIFREPPYKVDESGSEGFLMNIEVFLKNKVPPKRFLFKYNLFLNQEGEHLRCETLTFINPSKEFRRRLIKAGALRVVPKEAEATSRSSPDALPPPSKKMKTSHVSQEPSEEGSGSSN